MENGEKLCQHVAEFVVPLTSYATNDKCFKKRKVDKTAMKITVPYLTNELELRIGVPLWA